MANLYQLNEAIQNVLANSDENGEFNVDAFEALQVEKSEKQLNIIRYVQHLKNDQDLLKKEMDRLKKLKDAVVKREEWLKNYLAQSMRIDNVTKLDFVTHKAAFRKTPPRVVIADEESLPDKYIKTITVKNVDKEAIKADLKAGEVIEGCSLEQDEKLYIS